MEAAQSVDASNSKLEHVSPDSAFCNSEMSSGVTGKPRCSMRARVRGKDAGKITVSRIASALAAWISSGSTSIHSNSVNGFVSNQARLASSVADVAREL